MAQDGHASFMPPLPPRDDELRTTIEGVANFVARYGPDAEEQTRCENRGNPKFAFLFGGPFTDYYQYCLRVNVETHMKRTGPGLPPSNQPLPSAEVLEIDENIGVLRQQISDSERNLQAQKESFPVLRDTEFNKHVENAEEQKLQGYVSNSGLYDFQNFCLELEQLNNQKCSKDAITSSKKWILDNCTTDQQREVILMYMLLRVKSISSSDFFRLNILYLINDWAHHCQRKKLDNVTQMISRYVPQMYAFTVELSKDANLHPKLERLTGVWEGHKYFNDQCFKQLRNPTHIYNTSKAAIQAEYSKVSSNIEVNLQAMYAGYEQQHNNFVQHINQQISQMESRKDSILREQAGQSSNSTILPGPHPLIPGLRRSRFDQQQRFDEPPALRFFPPPPTLTRSAGNTDNSWRTAQGPQESKNVMDGDDIDGHPFDEDELVPKGNYYELPAALIVPQIPTESLNYAAIDPTSLRLPPRVPPSHKLLEAFEAFYQRPIVLDPNGWEPQALADFYDRKLSLRNVYEEKLKSEGLSIEDVITNKPNETDINMEREELEISVRKIIEERRMAISAQKREGSKSRSRSRSRSPSGTCMRRRRSPSSSCSTRSSKSKCRSLSRSRSSRTSTSSSRSSSHSRGHRSRSNSRSPHRIARDRSLSPPYRSRSGFGQPQSFVQPLTSDNKGAQLLQKMGWSGRGLGAQEAGIVEPIEGGELRGRSDQFRGLGSKPDMFEQFRKMRSSGYHDRNQQAFMEREKERHHSDR